MDTQQAQAFAQEFNALKQVIGGAVVGKSQVVGLVLTALLAGGHVLLEDVPGTGKTSLAKALAAAIDGRHGRVQFTPDLLPSDLIGANVFDQKLGDFVFKPGPVFCQILLGDEINRASPKVQSALLEVMEEYQVTLDGRSYPVERPFMVIATQNPIEHLGTYPLPEAQLDRFMLRTSLGHPDLELALTVLADSARMDRSQGIRPVTTAQRLVELQTLAGQSHIAESVLDYILRLAQTTRNDSRCALGVSMRGALALTRCAKVFALAHGRPYVIPDDVKALSGPVLAHRLMLTPDAVIDGVTTELVVAQTIETVSPPLLAKVPTSI